MIGMANAGNDILKSIYYDGMLYLVAEDAQAWFQHSLPPNPQPITSIRLVRLNVNPGFSTIPTSAANGYIDRRFGANAQGDPAGSQVYYGWPARRGK